MSYQNWGGGRHVEARRRGVAASPLSIQPAPAPTGRQLARPVSLGVPTNVSKTELRAAVERWIVMFACDDSGSMYGSAGDPLGVRYAAARSIIDLMSRAGGGQAGVVHWGTSAPRELALAPQDVRRQRRRLEAVLTIPPTLGGNDAAAALQLSRELLPEPDGETVQSVCLITDGCEPITPAIHEAVDALPPMSVHVLLIDHSHYCSSDLEAAWRALPLTFTRLAVNDPPRMTWQIAHSLFSSVGLQLPPLSTKSRRF